jgi:hypothetical protein
MDINKKARLPLQAGIRNHWPTTWKRAAALLAISSVMQLSVAQAQVLPYNEDFTTGTARDGATTADWDTAAGALKLPVAGSASPIQSLTGAFGPGSIGSAVDAADTAKTRDVASGDLDGDGDLDLVFANDGNNTVYLNNGAGSFTAAAGIPSGEQHFGSNTRAVAIADFNADGRLDVVFAEFGSGQETRVHFGNGNGSFSGFVDLADSGGALRSNSVAVGDVDNDGDIDVVIGNQSDYVRLFINSGFGEFGDAIGLIDTTFAPGNVDTTAVALGDLDRDGDLDVVAARRYGDTRIFRNNGSGNYNTGTTLSAAGATNNLDSTDSIALGDVDGDGWLDLVVGNNGSAITLPGSVAAQPNRIFLNSTNPADIFPAVSFAFTDGAYTNNVQLADYDRDGDLDIITADTISPNDGGVSPGVAGSDRVYINDPAVNTPNLFPVSGTAVTANTLSSISATTGDFNGDGMLDIVVANRLNDAANPAATGADQLILNAGVPSGTAADQLFASAVSVQVSSDNLVGGVILTETNDNTEANKVFTYWLSDDGGATWFVAHPEHSLKFPSPVGNDLRWRAELNSSSPMLRPNLTGLTIISNRTPSFSSTAVTAATQDVLYTYDVTTDDPNSGDLHVITAPVLPAWLTLTDNGDGTATLEGTPTNDNVGITGNDVTLTVTDSGGKDADQSFTIDVANVNDPPTVVMPIGDQIINEGEAINIDISVAFDDADGDTLTFSHTGIPASLTLDPATGIVTGTPVPDDVTNGPFAVTITADDGNMGTVSDSFMLTVNDIADDPVFDSTAVTGATQGTAYSYAIATSDPDGDALTITAPTLPAWLTLTDASDGTATLAGTPAAIDVGASAVVLRVTDATGAFSEQMFTITVQSSTPPPTNPPPRSSSGGCTIGPVDGAVDPTLPLLVLVSAMYLLRRRYGEV